MRVLQVLQKPKQKIASDKKALVMSTHFKCFFYLDSNALEAVQVYSLVRLLADFQMTHVCRSHGTHMRGFSPRRMTVTEDCKGRDRMTTHTYHFLQWTGFNLFTSNDFLCYGSNELGNVYLCGTHDPRHDPKYGFVRYHKKYYINENTKLKY